MTDTLDLTALAAYPAQDPERYDLQMRLSFFAVQLKTPRLRLLMQIAELLYGEGETECE